MALTLQRAQYEFFADAMTKEERQERYQALLTSVTDLAAFALLIVTGLEQEDVTLAEVIAEWKSRHNPLDSGA